MDLYLERQTVDKLKAGDARQFLSLFDAYFVHLYKYVRRRVNVKKEAEKIVRLTFLDALGQMQNTPNDVGYVVWLYSLARPRILDYFEVDKSVANQVQLIVDRNGLTQDNEELVQEAERMLSKLSFEEREILRLKFFEELTDGDVMYVLGTEGGTIGPRIYRVLKRAHFLLFGESDAQQGVYFGELSGVIAQLKNFEKISVPDAFQLTLKTELSNKIEKRDFAIDADIVQETKEKEMRDEVRAKIQEKAKGSEDPAKIFVEAVREMKEEENLARIKEERRIEKMQRREEFLDRWKGVFLFIPVAAFLVFLCFFAWDFFGFGKIKRGFPTNCDITVVFEGDFNEAEKDSVNEKIGDRICDHFDVSELRISKIGDGLVGVDVVAKDWILDYRFVKKKVNDWKIKQFYRERITDSDGESRQV